MIAKFTDSANNICCMQYVEVTDYFNVWSIEFPNVVHKFDCEEVEDYLNRGIWKRLS